MTDFAIKPTVLPRIGTGTGKVERQEVQQQRPLAKPVQTETPPLAKESALPSTAAVTTVGGDARPQLGSTGGREAGTSPMFTKLAGHVKEAGGKHARHDLEAVLTKLDAMTDADLNAKAEKLLTVFDQLSDGVSKLEDARTRNESALGRGFLGASPGMAVDLAAKSGFLPAAGVVCYGVLGALGNAADFGHARVAISEAIAAPGSMDTRKVLMESAKLIAGLAAWITPVGAVVRVGLEVVDWLKNKSDLATYEKTGVLPDALRAKAAHVNRLVQELGDLLEARGAKPS